MQKRQGKRNPFQADRAINRLIKLMRAKKQRRAEIELPGFTPDPTAPAGEEVWNAPGIGPPREPGDQTNLEKLSRLSGMS